jgi:hypothetical protein
LKKKVIPSKLSNVIFLSLMNMKPLDFCILKQLHYNHEFILLPNIGMMHIRLFYY